MRDVEFIPIFRKITLAFSGSRLADDPETIEVYYEVLKDLPAELVQAAALEYIASASAFPPTPGQIRDRAMRLTRRANKVPSAAEAWQEVREAPADGVKRWSEETEEGWVIYNQPYQWDSPLTEKVARNLGWPNMFWSDNLAADRARFLEAYKLQVEYSTEEATSLPEVQSYLERGQADIRYLLQGFKRDAWERGE